ncbi:MAG: MraY family glycosyltransferase [Bryobacteraceae bacterium]
MLLLALLSLGLSILLTPLIRDYCIARDLVDSADRHRKTHSGNIPRVGGVPIAIAYFTSAALLFLAPGEWGLRPASVGPLLGGLLPGALIVFLTGLADDMLGLPPWQKLAGQFLAAGVAWSGGVRVALLAGYSVESWWSFGLTVVWLIGCANAFNLIDGLDGLASGLGLFSTLTMMVAGLLLGSNDLVLALVPLAGCLLGFLRYNFNPASVFLGDSGSLLIGFLLGCFGAIWGHKSSTLLGMTSPLIALAVPWLDTAVTIVRRLLRYQPVFSGDRGHIHHRLLDHGLAPRKAALLLYAAGGLAGLFSLAQSFSGHVAGAGVLILFCLSAIVAVRQLRYAEFSVAGRLIREGAFQKQLRHEINLAAFERSLSKARSIGDCFHILEAAGRELGFVEVELRLQGEMFRSRLHSDSMPTWAMHVPLGEADSAILWRGPESRSHQLAADTFASILHAVLSERKAEAALLGQTSSLIALGSGIAAAAAPSTISDSEWRHS